MYFSVLLYSSLFLGAIFLMAFLFSQGARNESESRINHADQPLNEPLHTIVEVSGESFKNQDGVERQKIIAALTEREAVQLSLEPDNPFDKDAIAVISRRGQIGYVAKSDESRGSILSRLQDGLHVNAAILNIVGGTRDKPNLGVWLDVDIDTRNESRRRKGGSR